MRGLLSPAPQASATQYVTAVSTQWQQRGTGWTPSPPPAPHRDLGWSPGAAAAGLRWLLLQKMQQWTGTRPRITSPAVFLVIDVGKVKLGAGFGDLGSLPPRDKAASRTGLFHSYQKETFIFFVRPADKKLPSGGCEWQTPAWPVGACAAANYSRCHGGK